MMQVVQSRLMERADLVGAARLDISGNIARQNVPSKRLAESIYAEFVDMPDLELEEWLLQISLR
jgi:hypothetical protein